MSSDTEGGTVAAAGTEDRRDGSQARIATCRPVTIVSERHKGVVMADTVDLGPGGMFVTLDEPLSVGERFIFRIDLGEPYKPVLSGGEVRWIDSSGGRGGMGVRFLDIAEVADALGGTIPTRGPEIVRVRMEHVGPAVEARVVERSGGGLVVDLSLPFLRQGAPLEVGPDVAARSGRVKRTEWLGDKDGEAQLRLVVDLEPSRAQAAAGQVAATTTAERAAAPKVLDEERSKRTRPDPEPEAEEEREPPTLEWAAAEAPADEEPLAERSPAPALATPRPAPAPIEVEGEVEEEAVDDEAVQTAAPAERESSVAEAAPAEDGEDGDEVDAAAFSPFRGVKDRLEALGILPRLVALWGLLRAAAAKVAANPRVAPLLEKIKTRVNLEQLLAAARGLGTRVAGRLGPTVSGLLARVKGFRPFKKARKQSRGEPSKVVQALAARARRVTRGRGRSIAAVLLVALGAGGAATTASGLQGAAEAEASRARLRAEADQQGWSASTWQEPDLSNEDAG